MAVVFAGAALALAGCVATPVEASAPAPTTTVPKGIPAPEYQAALDAAEKAIGPVVDRFASVATPSALTDFSHSLGEVLNAQAAALGVLVPPAEVATQHQALVHGLRDAAALANGRKVAATGKNSCGLENQVPLNALRRLPHDLLAESRLKGRARALEAKGFAFGAFLETLGEPVVAPPLQSRRAGNNTTLVAPTTGGIGQLTITDTLESDVAVAVVSGDDPKAPQAMVYVRAGETATIGGLSGEYRIWFKPGTDWDDSARGFTRDCSFARGTTVVPADMIWTTSIVRNLREAKGIEDAPPF